MTTAELDKIGAAFLADHGARSAPILTYKFPGHTCISINDEAAHGIPGDRVIQEGDLVNIDVSAELDGYYADTGSSFAVPPVAPEKQQSAGYDTQGIAGRYRCSTGRASGSVRLAKRSEKVAKPAGYRIIRELGGHGVGRGLHEPPHAVPHYYNRHARQKLKEGDGHDTGTVPDHRGDSRQNRT